MKKRIVGIFLTIALACVGIMTSYAAKNIDEKVSISDEENVIKINIDDKNNPYLVDEGYISDIEIVPYGSNRPTKEWYLYDNQYTWSAAINGNTLYSSYYFTGHNGRFCLYAYKPSYSNVSSYSITIYKRKGTNSTSTYVQSYTVPTNKDLEFRSERKISENDQFYFKISGGRKANFAANGYVDAY
ncbi:hypothetical protein [Lachnoanaerobaculum gingivalis]|uniref:hypothetical protein n=1 Tax=Lachnoanaerobaculum gingivalis TaxID=2490855 RepID=UPI0024A6B779|nr:hypothetical protein [Lachnoanaerobaculum gingivalis]WHE86292.1 hypothetical protein QJR73_08300 [Lachnoanaerobaculum gingivalis]